MTPVVTRFGLMRHATTVWNEAGRIQGHSDSPLSDAGRHMAGEWAKILHKESWSRILCSDLGRAKATAMLLNSVLDLPMETDDRLREMNWGQWTGMTREEVRLRYADILQRQNVADWSFTPPDGESQLQVRERGIRALQDAAMKWPDHRILTVTHEGMMKCLFYDPDSQISDNEPVLMKPWRVHIMACTSRNVFLEYPNAIRLDASNPLQHQLKHPGT